ncbi:MAG: hypothetical protein ACRD1M_11960 [Terriglobales bacterium]
MPKHSFRCLTFAAALAVALCVTPACHAQGPTASASPQPLVWLDPANPYATYLEAAVLAKKTPVEFTILKDKATEVATLSSTGSQKGSAVRAIFLGAAGSGNKADLSLSVADANTGVVVFAYACVKNGEGHAFQSAAECLAKHWNDALKKKQQH